jgi:hypothetical protein
LVCLLFPLDPPFPPPPPDLFKAKVNLFGRFGWQAGRQAGRQARKQAQQRVLRRHPKVPKRKDYFFGLLLHVAAVLIKIRLSKWQSKMLPLLPVPCFSRHGSQKMRDAASTTRLVSFCCFSSLHELGSSE